MAFSMLPRAAVQKMPEVGTTAFGVYCVILDSFNVKNRRCCLSVESIGVASGLSRRAVQKSIAVLQSAGLLRVTRRGSGQKQGTNLYYPATEEELTTRQKCALNAPQEPVGAHQVRLRGAQNDVLGAHQVRTEQDVLTRRKEQDVRGDDVNNCSRVFTDEENAIADAFLAEVRRHAKYHDRTRKHYLDQALRTTE